MDNNCDQMSVINLYLYYILLQLHYTVQEVCVRARMHIAYTFDFTVCVYCMDSVRQFNP